MTRAAATGLAVAGLLLPCAARAHNVMPDADVFYAGMLHPLIVPGHLLSILALSLWLGRHAMDRAGPWFAGFGLALAVGLAFAFLAPWPELHEPALLAAAALLGGLTAAARPASWQVATVAAALVGLVVGLDSASDSTGTRSVLIGMAGTWLAAYLVLLNVAAIANFVRGRRLGIGVRVVAAWIAAIAAILLALSLAG